MSAYYIHDGRNEIGPFTIDLLKKQKLTRNTPVRQFGTNQWFPAERLVPLKDVVVPRKIKQPKDILPAAREHFHSLHQRKPLFLYAILMLLALCIAITIYSVVVPTGQTTAVSPPVTKFAPVATPAAAIQEVVEKKEATPPVVEDKAKAIRKRWNKWIAASNSNYGIGLLGGIKDLSVIITNRTDYPIDQAIAKITYFKANGGVWKTKLITILGIPAHDSKEQSVPDVGRGKKVKVSIQKIVSKKMKFSYTEGQKIRNADDPYVLE